ncbi:MAG: amidase family protein [Leucobacter sp.]
MSEDADSGSEAVLRAWEAARAAEAGGFVTVADPARIERELARVQRLSDGPDAEGRSKARPGAERAEAAGADLSATGARDPLLGLPIAVKDNIHVAGLPSTAATPALADFVPRSDAGAVALLRARGAVVIGKANMHELALGVTSTHTALGPVRNPVLPGRVAGGSSGGTAAVVAAGVCACGLGSDTGGSTRIPAALNDIWGYRPSTGRYPADGVASIAFSRDTVGPMTADLDLLRLLDAVLAGAAASTAGEPGSARDRAGSGVGIDGPALNGGVIDPEPRAPLRIGVDAADLDRCDAETAAAVGEALRRLRGASGIVFVPVDLSSLDRQVTAFEPLLGAQELVPSLASYLSSDERLPSLEAVMDRLVDPHVAHMLEGSLETTAGGVWTEQWHRLGNDCARARSAYLSLLRRHGLDAVLRPTVPIQAPLIDSVLELPIPGRNELFGVLTTFVRLATVVGSPSLSLPLGRLGGRSGCGLLLDGVPGCDEELLASGARIAAALTS